MDTTSAIPPQKEMRLAKKSLWNRRFTTGRLLLEMGLAAVAGIGLHIAPAIFLPKLPPNYEHAVFLPIISQVDQGGPSPHKTVLFFLNLVVPLALGFFGQGPIWLIGPALMLAFPVWTMVDLMAGGGGHNLWPFELILWSVIGLIYVVPTGIGRLARRGFDRGAFQDQEVK